MQQTKKLKEVMAEIEEAFCAMPKIAELFQQMEREIRYYNRYRWNEQTTKEKLIKKRDELLEVVKSIDNIDLTVLFYLRKLDGINQYKMARMLRELYQAQCDFKNELNQTDEYADILGVGWRL